MDFDEENRFEFCGQTTAFSSQFSQLRVQFSEEAPRHRARLVHGAPLSGDMRQAHASGGDIFVLKSNDKTNSPCTRKHIVWCILCIFYIFIVGHVSIGFHSKLIRNSLETH